jgi:predicted enzyme related to lactoylglutathione lyase
MTFVRLVVGAIVLGAAALVVAQEAPFRVWGVRVLATDVDALAAFYAKTFGLSEIARPVNSATTKEVILNVGATPDIARKATTAPVVIFTRPASAPAGAMASLILSVADLEKTIEAVKANGGR